MFVRYGNGNFLPWSISYPGLPPLGFLQTTQLISMVVLYLANFKKRQLPPLACYWLYAHGIMSTNMLLTLSPFSPSAPYSRNTTQQHVINLITIMTHIWSCPLFPLGMILWWALANPSCEPNLKSLASAVAEILKGKPQISGSSPSPGPHPLFLLVGFHDGP